MSDSRVNSERKIDLHPVHNFFSPIKDPIDTLINELKEYYQPNTPLYRIRLAIILKLYCQLIIKEDKKRCYRESKARSESRNKNEPENKDNDAAGRCLFNKDTISAVTKIILLLGQNSKLELTVPSFTVKEEQAFILAKKDHFQSIFDEIGCDINLAQNQGKSEIVLKVPPVAKKTSNLRSKKS